jgi:exodeoxyribonuclease X
MSTLIFDTETTRIDSPDVISAAWLRVDEPGSLEVLESFDQRYKPTHPITLGAMAVHHIMDEDLVDCPPAGGFRLPEDTEYLIGHNVDFDWRAIGKPPVKRIDTLSLCRKLWPEADSHTQSAMLYLLERATAREQLRDAHSAAADVQLCRVILGHILGRIEAPTWEELWSQSEDARVPSIMPFGKHKGLPIAEVPADYKRWLQRQTDVDPYLVKALQA